jgi:RHS repeat-associated protein
MTPGTFVFRDDENRLVDFDGAADQVDQSWNLSLIGDWDSVTTDSTTQNRTHGPTHELLTAGGSSVTHDAKGNMTSIPANLRDSSDPLSLNWDFDNRMKSADTDNDSTADVFYEFDALGRRVARDDGTQDTIFVQVGQQTIADYVSGTAAASPETTYAWGSYIDELILRTEPSGTDLYYHRNQQYSTYAVTNSTGAIQERYAYSPYGELTITDASGTTQSTSTDDTRYTYTGREWDAELGLYHYRARMYDPGAGRFCSRDPIGFLGRQFNLFAFCNDRPVNHQDPLGLTGIGSGSTCSPKLISSPTPYIDTKSGSIPGIFTSWADFTRVHTFLPSDTGLIATSEISVDSYYSDPVTLKTEVVCDVMCSKACDIIIICSATPNAGGLADEWNTDGDHTREGAASSAAYSGVLNGTTGTVTIDLEAAFIVATEGFETNFGLDVDLKPFGVGGGITGGMTIIHPAKTDAYPKKNDTKFNRTAGWECSCDEESN